MIDFIIGNPVQCTILALVAFSTYPVFELVYLAVNPPAPKLPHKEVTLAKGGES